MGHWKRAPPRVVPYSLRCAGPPGLLPMAVVPRGKKGGCDRPIVPPWRGITVAISWYRRPGIVRLSAAAGRDQRSTWAVRDGRNEGRSSLGRHARMDR